MPRTPSPELTEVSESLKDALTEADRRIMELQLQLDKAEQDKYALLIQKLVALVKLSRWELSAYGPALDEVEVPNQKSLLQEFVEKYLAEGYHFSIQVEDNLYLRYDDGHIRFFAPKKAEQPIENYFSFRGRKIYLDNAKSEIYEYTPDNRLRELIISWGLDLDFSAQYNYLQKTRADAVRLVQEADEKEVWFRDFEKRLIEFRERVENAGEL